MTAHWTGLIFALLFAAGWLLGAHAWSHVEIPQDPPEVKP